MNADELARAELAGLRAGVRRLYGQDPTDAQLRAHAAYNLLRIGGGLWRRGRWVEAALYEAAAYQVGDLAE